eukprot:CAMPEP_0182497034 /NCGR_PEP_ID=MMETSP1321-20130603/5584_1 /TAXON_ID=91990 /ORGANISM="Bolidomonas sp., Strain RCC1657" /LENGTH=101 /DNA_ID=CAMNT_0024700797 /DNA_START=52 /DNA_END=357 /DNA_ORIENTATION=-
MAPMRRMANNNMAKRGFKEKPEKDPFTMASFKKNWLGDPGAYPVIVIISGALVFCTFFMGRTLLTNPDVRINKKKRASILRYWGNGGDGIPPPKALGGPQY